MITNSTYHLVVERQRRPGEEWVEETILPDGTSIEYALILLSRAEPPLPDIAYRLVEVRGTETREVIEE